MPTVIYAYDPLDRLIQTAGIRRFYNRSRMTTEIEGAVQRSVFQVGDHVLAEGVAGGSNLLATDLQRSVLHTVNPDKTQPIAYSVYGHRPAESGLASVLGFNGERADPMTGHYVLGNGYRAYNPVLMRFNSPDSWSPFGKGGFNSYAYVLGDPINNGDKTGHVIKAFFTALKSFDESILGGVISAKGRVQAISSPVLDTSESVVKKSLKVPGYAQRVDTTTPFLNHLPPELIFKVTSYLPSSDMVSLASTSSHMNHLIQGVSDARYAALKQVVEPGLDASTVALPISVRSGQVDGVLPSSAPASGISSFGETVMARLNAVRQESGKVKFVSSL
ncbi:hypothetical protein GHO25_16380 [Pseudomonas sp. FSL R10-1350]|uniref:RHS repeat-associated core domain-containing protein n=1 Tax=Pseudomonas sp. FSL R10-1350 TaxID=2662197 RepID=UPI001297F867|nr:RHS repeat-associated core domain-containing protein [Pseudomonas sp. FSL R10-1350]MQU64696.1 hypothetical protein [Pseudomonas sp. FSL R10-1350]